MFKNFKINFDSTLVQFFIATLITLLIALITVPTLKIHTAIKENEKKVDSIAGSVEQAIRDTQRNMGIPIGELYKVFENGSFVAAENIANHIEHVKICRNSNDSNCENIYQNITLPRSNKVIDVSDYAAIVLTCGPVIYINASENGCQNKQVSFCPKKGLKTTIKRCIKKEFGPVCANIYVDINGDRKPNKIQNDIFEIIVSESYTVAYNQASFLEKKRNFIPISLGEIGRDGRIYDFQFK